MLCIANFAHAAYDANGYNMTVSSVTSNNATVKIFRAENSANKTVSVEYYIDARATSLKQGIPFTPGVSDMPTPYSRVSALMSVGLSNYFIANLNGLQSNSVYHVRYYVDNNYCAPDAICTHEYRYPTVGAWVRLDTLAEGGTTGEVLGFGTQKLQRGSTGIWVMNLQKVLNKYTGANLYPDGNFGLATKAAVQAFQMSKNMTPDGIVGTKTKQSLIQIQQRVTPMPTNTLQLTSADIGRTIKISQGQMFTVTLSNPGDGGYQFNVPDDGSDILVDSGRIHTNPTSGALGDFGKDMWTFYANRTGITNLKITASRPWSTEQPIVMFNVTVVVG